MSHNTTQFALPYYEMDFQCLNKIYTQKTKTMSDSLEDLLF
jgi:hypothetical protein